MHQGVLLFKNFTLTACFPFAPSLPQRDAYTWAHDHRVHHKYSETDADPHNAKRGFFFAHVGWVFLTPHPEVVAKRKAIDMSDLEADPIVMLQRRYYLPLFALLVIGLPVLVPWYWWGEQLAVAFWVESSLAMVHVSHTFTPPALCSNAVWLATNQANRPTLENLKKNSTFLLLLLRSTTDLKHGLPRCFQIPALFALPFCSHCHCLCRVKVPAKTSPGRR